MINKILLILGAVIPLFWGIAHIFPTKSVVKGFGDISDDNKYIITMEWLIEGITLIFIGLFVFSLTIYNLNSTASKIVYWISITQLIVLAIISLFTGFKVKFLPFRLCPLIFLSSSIFILLGILL